MSSLLQSRRTLYVGGLSDEVATDVTLRAAFIPFGPIKSIDIPRDYTKNAHKGFGFVEFEDADDAAEAIDNMEGSELNGKTITVSLAQPSQQMGGNANNSNVNSNNAAIWSTDEWFQQNAGIESDEQKQQRQRMKLDETQLQEQVAMP